MYFNTNRTIQQERPAVADKPARRDSICQLSSARVGHFPALLFFSLCCFWSPYPGPANSASNNACWTTNWTKATKSRWYQNLNILAPHVPKIHKYINIYVIIRMPTSNTESLELRKRKSTVHQLLQQSPTAAKRVGWFDQRDLRETANELANKSY